MTNRLPKQRGKTSLRRLEQVGSSVWQVVCPSLLHILGQLGVAGSIGGFGQLDTSSCRGIELQYLLRQLLAFLVSFQTGQGSEVVRACVNRVLTVTFLGFLSHGIFRVKRIRHVVE